MPPTLKPIDNGVNLWLDKPIVLIGRHPECDVQIESRKISRRHCCIAQVNEYLVIRDLGSTNGIRINGIRVVEGRLTPGDEVTIGNYRYRVHWGSYSNFEVPHQTTNGNGKHDSQTDARNSASQFDDQIDDELLESCEMPIALPEPGEDLVSEPLNESLNEPSGELNEDGQKELAELEKPSSDQEIHIELDPLSVIIPDVLELAGSHDNLPRVPPSPREDEPSEDSDKE